MCDEGLRFIMYRKEDLHVGHIHTCWEGAGGNLVTLSTYKSRKRKYLLVVFDVIFPINKILSVFLGR